MLGATVLKTEEPIKKPTRVAAVQKEAPKRQSTLDSMFADRMMLDATKHVEAIKKQKLKEEKEQKEQAEAEAATTPPAPSTDRPTRTRRSAPKKESAV
jgi:hypothetical protein